MEYLWLYLSMLITWILITIAEAAQLAVRAVKKGKNDWGGVSILPGILIMPIIFTGIAWLVNMKWKPVGFWIVGSIHLLIGILALGYIVYSIIYIKLNDKNPN
jgi:hypothetical protein